MTIAPSFTAERVQARRRELGLSIARLIRETGVPARRMEKLLYVGRPLADDELERVAVVLKTTVAALTEAYT